MPFSFNLSEGVSIGYLTLAFFCVFLNAFFVAAEFAMVKVRTTRLETLQSKGGVFAKWAYLITQHLNDYLSVAQLGITLASLGLGWVGEPAFAKLLEPFFRMWDFSDRTIHGISFAVAFFIISILHLVLGELVPKQMAIQMAEKILLATAVPMRFFYWLFYPFLALLNALTTSIIKMMGLHEVHAEEAHTEDEIRLILEDSYEEGSLSPRKASLLDNVFEFTHLTARQIMIPREDIVYLQLNKSAQENLEIAKESGHTRFPLCENNLDKVIGLVNIKDVIWKLEDSDNLINLYDLKRSILFIPEGKPIDQLLREFQSKKIHMAMVVDEFGVISGLVTLEDVIEVLVGQIQDEFDLEQPNIFKQSEDTFVVNGLTTIREVEQAFDLALYDETNISIGGYFIHQLGRLAKVGDVLTIPPYSVQVTEVKNRRVAQLIFKKLQ